MAYDFLVLMGLALALGFKHSYDADHLVAVSNVLARSESLRRTTWLSALWAVGHMVTATALALLLFFLRDAFLAQVLENLEFLVAVMLIVIGVVALLWEFNVLHIHEHIHDLKVHRHLHLHLGRHGDHGAMVSIGAIHGLASNDEILILFVVALGVTSLGGLLAGVAVFSLGVVLGMIVFGVGLNYPILRWGSRRVRRTVNVVAAVLSILYGLLIFAGFGGFNPIPLEG